MGRWNKNVHINCGVNDGFLKDWKATK